VRQLALDCQGLEVGHTTLEVRDDGVEVLFPARERDAAQIRERGAALEREVS